MKTSLSELQKTLYTTLKGNTALMTEITGVYVDVPDTATLPYVVLGEDTVVDWSTKTFNGEEITHTLHVWASSTYKTKQILSLVLETLTTAPLTIGGVFSVEDTKRDFVQVFTEQRGINDTSNVKHGVLRVRLKISQ